MRSRRNSEERRVLEAIRVARMVVPAYGRGGPVSEQEVRKLARFNRLRISRAAGEMDSPAVLTPPWDGTHRLILAEHLGPSVSRYITLHEIGHIMAGDADELTVLRFTGPLPEAEEVADQFALLGILDDVDLQLGDDWVEQKIRELVPLDDRGWQVHRIPRLAGKVVKTRIMVSEWIDGA